MIVGILASAISFIAFLVFRKKDTILRKMTLAVFLLSVVGILVQYTQSTEHLLEDDTSVIQRNPAGDGDQQADLILNADDVIVDYEYVLTVPEEQPDQESAWEQIELAEEEIMGTFPGENDALDHVIEDVVIHSNYQNGLVLAEWSFDNYDYVDVEGKLQTENIPEEGYLEKATCELTCGDYTGTYDFFFRVYPKELTETEQILKQIKEEIADQSEKEAETELTLPQEIDGYVLQWTEVKSQSAWKFSVLGILLAVGIWLSEKEKGKKEQKLRELHLTLDYPEIVSKLALLLGAGMTLNAAWNRISASYLNERQKNSHKIRPAYEEMLVTCRETESGIGERMAYEHFGERCGTRRYRKLSSLLIQNAKKGTKGLAGLLEQEAEEAFEERKNVAKKLGEEAGTKMLLPMMLMLGIVILLIMIPAVISFSSFRN